MGQRQLNQLVIYVANQIYPGDLYLKLLHGDIQSIQTTSFGIYLPRSRLSSRSSRPSTRRTSCTSVVAAAVAEIPPLRQSWIVVIFIVRDPNFHRRQRREL